MTDHQSALKKFAARIVSRSTLSPREKDRILTLAGRTERVRQNHDLIQPRDQTGEATLVVKGLVGRYDTRRDGRRQLTAVYVPGDMCDLHSVPVPTAGGGLTSLNQTTIMKIPHSAIRQAALDLPNLTFAFWRDTIVDASILAKWAANLGRRESRVRLAHFLCEMGVRLEAIGEGERNSFNLDLSQFQLAEVIGVTAVHVNRTLQELRSEGILTTAQRHIEIPDWERLCRIAEFDAEYLLLPGPDDGVSRTGKRKSGPV